MAPKERFLSPEEIARLDVVLTRDEFYCPQAVAIIRLLLLAGCRFGEIAGLQWDWIKGRRIFLPDSKSGPRPRRPRGRMARCGRRDPPAGAHRLPSRRSARSSVARHRNGSDSPSRQQDRIAQRTSRRRRQGVTRRASWRAARRRLPVPAIRPRPGAVPVRDTLARRMRGCLPWQATASRPPSHLCQPCRHVRRKPALGRQTARTPAAQHHRRLRPPRRRTPRRSGREGGKNYLQSYDV